MERNSFLAKLTFNVTLVCLDQFCQNNNDRTLEVASVNEFLILCFELYSLKKRKEIKTTDRVGYCSEKCVRANIHFSHSQSF